MGELCGGFVLFFGEEFVAEVPNREGQIRIGLATVSLKE